MSLDEHGLEAQSSSPIPEEPEDTELVMFEEKDRQFDLKDFDEIEEPSLEDLEGYPETLEDFDHETLSLNDFDQFLSAIEEREQELRESHLHDPIKKIPKAEELIKNSVGTNLLQAYLYGLSQALESDMIDILELFLDVEEPDRVFDGKFDDIVHGDYRLEAHEWELKHMMKKAGCDRNLFYNSFASIVSDNRTKKRFSCNSMFCPRCHSKEVLATKKNLMNYVMEAPHTHFTFTMNQDFWNRITYDRDSNNPKYRNRDKAPRFIDHIYKSVGEAVSFAFQSEYNLEVGTIVNTHTFSSKTLEWQPHADVFVSLKGVDPEGTIKDVVYQGVEPENRKWINKNLHKKMRAVFTAEMVSRLFRIDLNRDYEQMYTIEEYYKNGDRRKKVNIDSDYFESLFDMAGIDTPDTDDNCLWVRQNTNSDGDIIVKKLVKLKDFDSLEDEDLSQDDWEISGGLLGDTLRYFKRLPVADENIINIEENMIIFTTNKRKAKNLEPLCLTPEEFYIRVSQHVKPRGFRQLRPYGVYSWNHSYHDLVKREAGYLRDMDFNVSRDLSKIAEVVYEVISGMGEDIDPEGKTSEGYKDKLGYILVNSRRKLRNLGILSEDFSHEARLSRVIRSLIDFSLKEERDTDSIVYTPYQLKELMKIDSGKEIKSKFGQEVYEVYDKIRKKVYAGFQNPVMDEETDEFCLWIGFSAYGEFVSRSRFSFAIFNNNDFKKKHNNLHNLLQSSNCEFPELIKENRGEPDGKT